MELNQIIAVVLLVAFCIVQVIIDKSACKPK